METETVGIVTHVMTWFGDIPAWLTAVTTLVTAATAITDLTDTRKDDMVIGKVLWVLNIVAGNIGKNKNLDA